MKPFSMELESLYDKRNDLLQRKKDFFEGDEPDYNDQGYQDILNSLDAVTEEIDEIEEGFEENTTLEEDFEDFLIVEISDEDIDDNLEDNYTIDDF